MSKEILFPVGRLVGGSVSKGRDTDYYGKPLTNKDGTPAIDYSFGVAYAKHPNVDWKQEPWGAAIVAQARLDFPNGQPDNPAFAYKVHDGDSAVPNKKGNKPCDNEGWPGHWVLFFSSRFAPKVLVANGSCATDPALVKPGHFVEVLGDVKGNGSTESPGIYLNHVFVAHSAPGKEIMLSDAPDPSTVGFGQQALPAGANAAPESRITPPAPSTPAPPAPVPTAPHNAILNGPPAPPAPQAHVMLPAAQGHSYESYKQANWSDEQLIAAGMMQA